MLLFMITITNLNYYCIMLQVTCCVLASAISCILVFHCRITNNKNNNNNKTALELLLGVLMKVSQYAMVLWCYGTMRTCTSGICATSGPRAPSIARAMAPIQRHQQEGNGSHPELWFASVG